jgi:hypothetical protein
VKRKPPKPKTPKSPKTALPPAEWAFHRVPVEEWDAATNYEYQREAALLLNPGAGAPKELRQFWQFWLAAAGLPPSTNPIKQKPWANLLPTVRRALASRFACWEQFIEQGTRAPLAEIRPARLGDPESAFLERVVFDIDWRARDAALVKKFTAWLVEGRKQKRGFLPELRPANRTGPKAKAPALCDLVIWRCRRAGLTMKATAELVHPFLQRAGGIGKVCNPIQRARACQNAEKKINGYAQMGVQMFKRLPAYRPVEDWIALARGKRLSSIIERMKAKAATLNKVSKPNRGK